MPIVYRPESVKGHQCRTPQEVNGVSSPVGTVWDCPVCGQLFRLSEDYTYWYTLRWRRMGWIETRLFRRKLRKRGR